MDARGSLCKVRAGAACLSLHREGRKLTDTHIHDLPLVSNKQNLKEEFYPQFLKNSEKMVDIRPGVTNQHSKLSLLPPCLAALHVDLGSMS